LRLSSVFLKGGFSTSWVWDLYSIFNDLFFGGLNLVIFRIIFSLSLFHLSLVTIWLSLIDLFGGYCSNYSIWLLDSVSIVPSSHLVWFLFGQESLNFYVGGSYEGLFILSGLFYLWKFIGVSNLFYLKFCALFLFIMSLILLVLSYIF
jgi:hypothetical protein